MLGNKTLRTQKTGHTQNTTLNSRDATKCNLKNLRKSKTRNTIFEIVVYRNLTLWWLHKVQAITMGVGVGWGDKAST